MRAVLSLICGVVAAWAGLVPGAAAAPVNFTVGWLEVAEMPNRALVAATLTRPRIAVTPTRPAIAVTPTRPAIAVTPTRPLRRARSRRR